MDYGYKLTTHGLELMAACMANKAPLNLTRVAMGSGLVPEGTNLADVHELVNYVVDGAVGDRHHEDNRLYLTVQYENQSHPETPVFMMNEFIVYAEHPVTGEETDLLYATLGDYRQPIPPYSEGLPPSVWKYPMILVVSNEVEVVVTAPAGTVTFDQLEESVGSAIRIHTVDEGAHQDIRRSVKNAQSAADTAASAADDAKTAADEAKQAAEQNAQAIQTVAEQQSQMAGGMVCMTVIEFTIPPEAWVEDTAATGRYVYSAEVVNENASASHYPRATLDRNSLEIAYAAGMCPDVNIAEDGKLSFSAELAPTEPISGTCELWTEGGAGGGGSGGGGGSYVLPIATAFRLGGVKIGEGVNVAPDGTISADVPSVVEKAAETDAGAEEMLDEVFNKPADSGT